jgi:alcohol dehydrogenase, propanol-preferring
MRALVLEQPQTSLQERDLPSREPGPGQVRIAVRACGVCRTDLHIRDGELPDPKLPLVLGHEIVGTVVEGGERYLPGDRIGVPWLG